MPDHISLQQRLAYEPHPPGFGTSGVRALVTDLTDFEVYCLTRGTLQYFADHDLLHQSASATRTIVIPVAHDLRPSSPRLTRATIKAIIDCGYQADYVGAIPTPALTFYALQQGVASFMVTGSHIPLDRNGQKANRYDGEVMKNDEAGIVAAVSSLRQQLLNEAADTSLFDHQGMFKPDVISPLPAPSDAAQLAYSQRYQTVFPANSLSGLRLAFFQYSAVGRDLLPEILRNAGAEVICCGRSEQFVPLDTEALSEQHLTELLELTLSLRAEHGRIDAMLSTDGDSDRPLLIAIEEKPVAEIEQQTNNPLHFRFISGDLLGLLVSDYLQADSLSVPISSNPAVNDFFAQQGCVVNNTKIGSPYVIASMRAAQQAGSQAIVAWEANGGYLTGSDLTLNQAELAALPTRDAILPLLCVLHLSVLKQQSLLSLLQDLPAYYGQSGLLDEFPREKSQELLIALSPENTGIIWVDFLQNSIQLSKHNAELAAELALNTEQSSRYTAIKHCIEGVFSSATGFGALSKICYLDGLRCYFDNGDIAHVRPSGNAPQLRIYAFANTQQRAATIVNMALAEPEGLLRQLSAASKCATDAHC